MTWRYIKVSSDTPEKKLQVFLDAQQYSKKGILKYEKVFGHRYVSTGGEHTTMEFCRLLHLQRGQKVLDVGCGIGGSAFFMAQVILYPIGISLFQIETVFRCYLRNMVSTFMALICPPI